MQRVTSAAVTVEGQVVGSIGPGLMVLVGVTHTDTADTAAAAARKVGGLRILRGERSVTDGTNGTNGVRSAILAVSQFTLYGDTRKGRRPTWAAAAPGPQAEPVFDAFVAALRADGITVETGVFGADMRVELVNDGPVTVMVEI